MRSQPRARGSVPARKMKRIHGFDAAESRLHLVEGYLLARRDDPVVDVTGQGVTKSRGGKSAVAYRNSPSNFCSSTVNLPMGARSWFKTAPDTTRYLHRDINTGFVL
jgi:hypothetical protein